MSYLGRWSERKREAASRECAPEVPMDDESAASLPGDAPTDAPTDAPETTTLPRPEPGTLDQTLPDPDTLPAGSDIRAFLAPGVSAGLRRRALRRLFAADHYAIRDGLDDYDVDYRQVLKPMAGEVAQRLRRWSRRLGDEEPTADELATGREGDTVTAEAGREQDDDSARSRMASHQGPLDEGGSGENAESDQH